MPLTPAHKRIIDRLAAIDGPRRKRQLLRMWLEMPGGRRVMPEYTWQAQSYKRIGALRAL